MTEDKYNAVVAILGPPNEVLTGQPPYATEQDIFAWWTPVIDRTLDDCVYGNPRGCIDQTLLNRLESDIDYIEYKLATLNFVADNIDKSDGVWTRQLYVLYSDMERIRSNLEILCNSGAVLADTPIPQKIHGCEQPGYELINEWERILYDIKAVLTAIERSRLRVAQPLLYCGFSLYMLNTDSEEDTQ